MSQAALRYVAEKCRHACIGGSVRNLLWVLAYLVPKGERWTPAVWLRTLEEMTGDDLRTVQRSRDVLSSPEVGEIAVHTAAAKQARYELVKLHVQGELFGLRAPGKDDKLSRYEFEAGRQTAMTSRQGVAIDSSPHYVRPVLEEGRSSSSPRALVDRVQEAQSFLEQFIAEFPEHNGGAQYTSDLEADTEIVMELLEHRRISRLLAMSRLMWGIERVHDHRADCQCDSCWIARSDKNIRILRHKCNLLDRQAGQLALDAPAESREDVMWSAILDRVRSRAKRWDVETWLRPCQLVSHRNGTVTIMAPTQEHRDCIRSMGLEDALAAVVGEVLPGRRVTFIVGSAIRAAGGDWT